LDQVQKERGPKVGRNATEDDARTTLVERRSAVGRAGYLVDVNRHHRELRLGPDPTRELVEPWVVERVTLRDRGRGHAIAPTTIGGRWVSSPYAQPSRSMT